MEFSTTRLEQVAKLLADEIKERMAEKQGINEMEQMMRELVKTAAGLGLQQVIEQGEERYARKEIECCCGEKAQFVSKRAAVLWTVFGKVGYQRGYYLCGACHQGQSPLDQKYEITPGQVTQALASLLGYWEWRLPLKKPANCQNVFFCFGSATIRFASKPKGMATPKRKQKKTG